MVVVAHEDSALRETLASVLVQTGRAVHRVSHLDVDVLLQTRVSLLITGDAPGTLALLRRRGLQCPFLVVTGSADARWAAEAPDVHLVFTPPDLVLLRAIVDELLQSGEVRPTMGQPAPADPP